MKYKKYVADHGNYFWKKLGPTHNQLSRFGGKSISIVVVEIQTFPHFNTFNINENKSYDQTNYEQVNSFINKEEYLKNYSPKQRKTLLITLKEFTKVIKKLNSKVSLDQLGISNVMIHKLPPKM